MATDHCQCQRVIYKDTKAEIVSDTIEFRHHELTLPSLTPDNKVLHGVQQLTEVLKYTPESTVDAQIQSIKALHDNLEHWAGCIAAPTETTDLPHRTLSTQNQRAPRVPTATPVRPPALMVQGLV